MKTYDTLSRLFSGGKQQVKVMRSLCSIWHARSCTQNWPGFSVCRLVCLY